VKEAADWLFRNRQTGRWTIGQRPNLSLGLFFAAAVIRRLADDGTTIHDVASVIAPAAAIWWAADEIIRGVNPWRRILGSAVLAATVIGLARRI